ncbi:hypothetical protein GE09DRAFT_1050787 [Coniochaeta sp. 2T2.1]|nr:hypothetical protein GE09DRAFT_1050787 [Coniochaeta sp. 2T2.1]
MLFAKLPLYNIITFFPHPKPLPPLTMSSNPTQAFSMQEEVPLTEQDLRTFMAMVNDRQTTEGFFRDITAATKFVIDAEKDDIGTADCSSHSQPATSERDGVASSSHTYDVSSADDNKRSEDSATPQNSEVEVRTAQAVTLERHAVAEAGPYTMRRGRLRSGNEAPSLQPGEHFQTAGNTQYGTDTNPQTREQYGRGVSIATGASGTTEPMPRFSQVLSRNTDSTFLPDDHILGLNVLGVPHAPHARTHASPIARNTDSTLLTDDHIVGLNIMGVPLGPHTRTQASQQLRNTDSTLLTDDNLVAIDIWGVPHAPYGPGIQGSSQPRNTDSTLLTDDHIARLDILGVPHASMTKAGVMSSDDTASDFVKVYLHVIDNVRCQNMSRRYCYCRDADVEPWTNYAPPTSAGRQSDADHQAGSKGKNCEAGKSLPPPLPSTPLGNDASRLRVPSQHVSAEGSANYNMTPMSDSSGFEAMAHSYNSLGIYPQAVNLGPRADDTAGTGSNPYPSED